jgi:DNA polymerase-1
LSNYADLKVQRTAIIDGDVLVYTAAAGAASRQQDIEELGDRVISEVAWWTKHAFCQNTIVAFSCSRADNYRRDFWPKYKAHRDGQEAPAGLADAIAHVKSKYRCMTLPRTEADDILGIIGTDAKPMKDGSIPVIVTRDKDLRQIPGWHYNPEKEDFPVWVSREAADRFFYQQWMTGDPTDNIPGLFRFGPAKAGKLLDATPREGWDAAIQGAYRDHPKRYDPAYCLAQARCARILRADEWDKAAKKPILWTPGETLTWESLALVDPDLTGAE